MKKQNSDVFQRVTPLTQKAVDVCHEIIEQRKAAFAKHADRQQIEDSDRELIHGCLDLLIEKRYRLENNVPLTDPPNMVMSKGCMLWLGITEQNPMTTLSKKMIGKRVSVGFDEFFALTQPAGAVMRFGPDAQKDFISDMLNYEPHPYFSQLEAA